VLHFVDLLEVLSHPTFTIPEYVKTNHLAMALYTEPQMDLIVLMLEARHWYGWIVSDVMSFHAWGKVFTLSRQEHREASGIWIGNIDALKNANTPNDWANTVSKQDVVTMSREYLKLKRKYFPLGIDEAIAGFVKHYAKMSNWVNELRKRRDRLAQYKDALGSHRQLEYHCNDAINNIEPLLAEYLELAYRWFRGTAHQLEVAQLPGAIHSLRYGEHVSVDYFRNQVSEKLAFGAGGPWNPPTFHWVSQDNILTPIRMRPTRPGSPWCDWLRNVRDPLDYGESFQTRPVDPRREKATTQHDPIQIRLPHNFQAIASIFNVIRR
jgi:hypothetical protein